MMVKAVIFGTIGTACLIRGFFRPTRAIAKRGEIRRCSGTNSFGVCDPSVGIATAKGEAVHSAVSGKVVTVGTDYIHVMARNEPVILMYQGIVPAVSAGQYVGPGQTVGASAGNVNFSVTQMGPGKVALIAPSAWLAARGFSVLDDNRGNKNLWCAGGRHINVPPEARQKCELRKPEGASFALLPISVEMN